MEHSNIFYSLNIGKGFAAEQNARTFKNAFGLDLVQQDGRISEGKSGLFLCKTSEFDATIEKYGLEKINSMIDRSVSLHGISPRYTRPDETKLDVFGAVEVEQKESGTILALEAYDGNKHYFCKIEEPFYIRETQKEQFNAGIYILVNGYMLYIDQRQCMDEARVKLANMGDIMQAITERFNASMASESTWNNIEFARILDRVDEAEEHNAIIQRKREIERLPELARAEELKHERKQKIQEEQSAKIANAEQKIRAREQLLNDEHIDGCSIVLFIMKKNGIVPPIKTQGWINNNLHSLKQQASGEYGYSFWKGKHQGDSGTFWQYLDQLVRALDEQAA